MDRHLLGGGKLHPLIGLAINSSSAFSHDFDFVCGYWQKMKNNTSQ
jgi:hypothetical protein